MPQSILANPKKYLWPYFPPGATGKVVIFRTSKTTFKRILLNQLQIDYDDENHDYDDDNGDNLDAYDDDNDQKPSTAMTSPKHATHL